MFGRGSTGGAINQVSKSPSLQPGRTFSLTSGYGPTVRGTVDVNAQPLGDTSALRLNLARLLQRRRRSRRDLAVALRYRAGLYRRARNADAVLPRTYYTHDEGTPDYGFPTCSGPCLDVPRGSNYGLANQDFERDDVYILTLRLDHAFSDAIKMRNALRVAYYHRASRRLAAGEPGRAGRYAALADHGHPRAHRARRARQQLHRADRLHVPVRYLGAQARLIAGLEFSTRSRTSRAGASPTSRPRT